MQLTATFDESDALCEELLALIDLPLADESPSVVASDAACSLSLEHWHGVRALLRAGFYPSALVAHRAQYECLVLSVWLAYSASENQVSKLTVPLSLSSEPAAKSLPQVADMLEAIGRTGPRQAYEALSRFRQTSWNALNSYVHAGIHPLHRHHRGFPDEVLLGTVRNANGLGVVSCMQAVAISGQLSLQPTLLQVAGSRPQCVPPPL